jgi:aurora kinase
MLEQFTQELKINLYLNHSNVVKMYGFFHDPLHIYIIMEYMEEGSLYRFIKLNKKLKEEEVIAKLVEICEAVSYIHSLDVLHRDIKP